MKIINRKSKEIKEEKIITNNLESKKINFRLDIFLYQKIRNFLIGKENSGNYDYPSFSSFIRKALLETSLNNLSYKSENKEKKSLSCNLDEESLAIYNSFSKGAKNRLLERIIGSYLNKII